MRKVLLSLLVVSSFAGYAAYQRFTAGPADPLTEYLKTEPQVGALQLPIPAPPMATAMAAFRPDEVTFTDRSGGDDTPRFAPNFALAALTDTQQPATAPVPTELQVAANVYRDGTFKGTLVDAYYGNLQVAAVVTGGRLTDVQILTYPADRSRSQRINQVALPRLKQEAISLQSASVHIVSGATPTSRAFATSLAAALKTAGG